MTVNCDHCDYWKEGIEKINRFIFFEQARNPHNQYTGKAFDYCPWCGNKLSKSEDKAA